MSLLTLSLIAGFGSASYCVGLTQILRGNYRPNTFSRGILLLYPLPLINLSIGLFAHFIGGIPTFKNAYRNNESESTAFWSLFFIASLISLIASIGSPLRTMIFPLYFVGFDGLMILLSVSTRQSPLTSPPERSQL